MIENRGEIASDHSFTGVSDVQLSLHRQSDKTIGKKTMHCENRLIVPGSVGLLATVLQNYYWHLEHVRTIKQNQLITVAK